MAADLGPGWTMTGDQAPVAETRTDPTLRRCAGAELDAARAVAASHTRTFEHPTLAGQQQLTVSSAVLASEGAVDDLFRVAAGPGFFTCVAADLRGGVEGDVPGVTVELGAPVLREGTVPAADHSILATASIVLRDGPSTTEGGLTMVLLSTGPVVSVVFGFGLGAPLDQALLDPSMAILQRRQRERGPGV